MKHTDPMKKETYETPLVQDIEPFTVTCVAGTSQEQEDDNDATDPENDW